MSKFAWAAAVALFSAAFSFGQSPAVILQNQEDAPFYYVMDPTELAGLTTGSPLLASTVAGYFSTPDAAVAFAKLPPQGDIRLTGLTAGSHLLVGFFQVPNSDTFPVRVMAIQADPSVPDRFYSVFAGTAQLSVRRGVGKLASFGSPSTAAASAGGAAAGALAGAASPPSGGDTGVAAAGGSLPLLASFSSSYDPVVFTRETKDAFTVLPIAQARSWTQAGTRVTAVQGTWDADGLHVSLAVPGGFSPSVFYFLYVFDGRTAGQENTVTLEIEPLARAASGACILWQKGSPPTLIGSVTTAAQSVELDVSRDAMAASALAGVGPSPTIDLTAGSYDRAQGTWEEFYYSTLSFTR